MRTPEPRQAPSPVYEDRLRHFLNLMPHRVRRLLLLGSRHDSFLLEEDGRLHDLILSEFLDTSLRSTPWLTRFSTGREALSALTEGRKRFDCVVVTSHVRDMHPGEFARRAREAGVKAPLEGLAFDATELDDIRRRGEASAFDRLYAWQGDFRILLGIVKSIEDRWNVRADTHRVGVSSILLIEDGVRYYSSFLPTLYRELLQQSQRVVSEGTNLTNKLMRMRARPKVLHCTTYEEAIGYFRDYRRTLLGIISDVDFPRGGKPHAQSGLDFARMVRETEPSLPILLQTRDPEYAKRAEEVGASVLLKGSPLLLEELSRYIRESFGFGDFVFRLADGTEVGRASDLREVEAQVAAVPDASLVYHAERNHFSTWLRARTEFSLAEDLRRRKVADFGSVDDMRRFLVESIREFRRERLRGAVSVFDPEAFDAEASFAKLGGGSLGGKARGLAFVRKLLHEHRLRDRFPGVRVGCPSAVVIGTEVFDRFLDENDLRDFAMREADDAEIERRFLAASFPEDAQRLVLRHLETVNHPLAVRSSSLLEDSQHLPFAGVYRTYMVPNSHSDRGVRARELLDAVKRIWASTYFRRAKAYIDPTPYRLEQEKMAVILQRLVGARHGPRFYPDISGVARSYNFYPTAPMAAADGIVNLALGLGETIVGGGKSFRFCPRWPKHPAFATTQDLVANAQSEFHALVLEGADSRVDPAAELSLGRFGLETAREDGTLARVASTWSPENEALYDGLGRPGAPVVTFAPVLKHEVFPLPEIARALLDVGTRGLNMPVEIEFAVNLSVPPGEPAEFAVLQLRPAVAGPDAEPVDVGTWDDDEVVCRSERVLGNGRIEGVHDLIVVPRDGLDRARSVEAAADVARMNARLAEEGRPYVLVGVGRWGAADPWMGIPVTWEQISGARIIVEAPFRDFEVAPSQGSHFFQNLTASSVGYFTVGAKPSDGLLAWDWLAAQPAAEETALVRRVRLDAPLTVLMDGRSGRGVILRPR